MIIAAPCGPRTPCKEASVKSRIPLRPLTNRPPVRRSLIRCLWNAFEEIWQEEFRAWIRRRNRQRILRHEREFRSSRLDWQHH